MVSGIIAEIFSIGMVLPFLGVLLSPEKIYNDPSFQFLIESFGLTRPEQLILPITIIFGVVVMISGIIRLSLLWWLNRFANAVGNDLGSEAYRRTLYQPYSVHVQRNSAEIGSVFVKKIDVVIYSIILPLLMLITSMIMVLSIMIFMVYINPALSLLSFLGFGGLYVLVAVVSKKYLSRDSQLLTEKQGQVAKVVQEGLGSIRDVLIDQLQEVYYRIYRQVDNQLRRALCNIHILASAPRPILEAFSLVLVSLLAFALTRQEGGLISAMPTLGALVLAAQRILPLVQQSYTGWSYIQGGKYTLIDVLELLEQPLLAHNFKRPDQPLSFKNKITLKNLDFGYNSETPLILKGLQFEIMKGSRVGFIGPTGCGKSSLLDILMGLLSPSKGQLLVDDIEVNESNQNAWKAHIAHVPQFIYLTDATIAENIAFGQPLDEIDWKRMEYAAKKAQITSTIKKFEEGYLTIIGENGIRLSGGQRQRLGLARAFYKQANVLVLDEATSALDSETETLVMNSINELEKELTVLIVAHRITTLRNCDIIVELSEGAIIQTGAYDEIIGNNERSILANP